MVGPCWIFTARLNRAGYGVIWDSDAGENGRNRPAHRVSYEIFRGPILKDEPDHLCRVKACVSPWHLEDVTRSENCSRADHAGPWKLCRKGHPFTPENTYMERTPTGTAQRCKACENMRKRRQYRDRVGLPVNMPVRGNPDVCPSGHPRAIFAEWPKVKGKPTLRCSECRRINVRKWQAKQRAKRIAAI